MLLMCGAYSSSSDIKTPRYANGSKGKSKSKKSKKTLFQVGTETNKNISSYLKISASHRPESWAMYNIYNMVKCKRNIV